MLLRQKARLSFKGRQSGSPSRKKRYEQAPHSLAGYTPATPHTVLSAWLRLEKVQLCNPEPTTLPDPPGRLNTESLDMQHRLARESVNALLEKSILLFVN